MKTLGDGTGTTGITPVSVTGLTDAITISAGERHSCAVLIGGAAKCWDANDRGKLGVNPGWVAVQVLVIP